MQLLPLLLVAVLVAVDGGVRPVGAAWGLSEAWVLALALTPVGAILLLAHLGVARCARQLTSGRGARPALRAERLVRWSRWLILANHAAAVLVFDWLGTVREWIGDPVLLDELIALLPALLGLIGTWWVYYPIERRLLEALTIRRLDEGQALYPLLTRGQYVLLQLRLHVLLLLVPILLILTLSETIDWLLRNWQGPEAQSWRQTITFVGALLVFILSPLLARFLLDVQPLAAGELREMLLAVCTRHRVRVRQLLIWNTNGSMINAAVMGLLGPLRFVLMTDALLETLRRDQVEAVMAHEVGHVRRHHMPWLIACLLASFVLMWMLIQVLVEMVVRLEWAQSRQAHEWIGLAAAVGHLALGLWLFGWICRRFERQADTFAVQHLSGLGTPAANEARITPESVRALSGALNIIARLNSVDPEKKSWRHGSIAWRERYLNTIVGLPVRRLKIDRLMRWIKLGAAVVLLGSFAFEAWRASLGT